MQFILWALSAFVLIALFPLWAIFVYGVVVGAIVMTFVVAISGSN